MAHEIAFVPPVDTPVMIFDFQERPGIRTKYRNHFVADVGLQGYMNRFRAKMSEKHIQTTGRQIILRFHQPGDLVPGLDEELQAAVEAFVGTGVVHVSFRDIPMNADDYTANDRRENENAENHQIYIRGDFCGAVFGKPSCPFPEMGTVDEFQRTEKDFL